MELTEEMLKSEGWAYLFDLTFLEHTDDEDAIKQHIWSIYKTAIDGLLNQRSKKLKKGPIVVWYCLKKVTGDQNQLVDGYILMITPYYRKLTGRDSDPIEESMWKHKGYIRASSAIPLLEGAVPACILTEGEVYPLDSDETFSESLSELFEEHQYMLSLVNPRMELRSNPYQN